MQSDEANAMRCDRCGTPMRKEQEDARPPAGGFGSDGPVVRFERAKLVCPNCGYEARIT